MTTKGMRPVLKPGSKIEKLYNWLKREMVGAELLFTSEHALQLVGELPVKKPEFAWNMLQQLERRDLVTRTRRPHQKGIIVSFINKNSAEPVATATKMKVRRRSGKSRMAKALGASRELSVRELMDNLDIRIARLEAELADKRTFRKSLAMMVGR